MQVKIREADEHDFPGILTLIKEFSIFQGAEQKVTITIEQMMEDKTFFQCFVAEINNKEVVGFASFFFAYYSWTGRAVYLDDLYIKEAYRKQGTGKKLFNAVIDLARKEKCRKLRWQVSKWNSNAIRFYKSIGATIDEVEINCDLIIQHD